MNDKISFVFHMYFVKFNYYDIRLILLSYIMDSHGHFKLENSYFSARISYTFI